MFKHPVFLHVKSFVASPFRYVASRAVLTGMGTQHERWADLGNFDPAWDERTALMAAMVAPNSSVLEFGSGREQLARFLPPGCQYQPADIVARSARTLVVDLNGELPQLPKPTYDYIVFSGVIEYIHDLPRLFAFTRMHGRHVILSYAATDELESIPTRMENGWVHHFTQAAIEQMLRDAGFTIGEKKRWREQTIYAAS